MTARWVAALTLAGVLVGAGPAAAQGGDVLTLSPAQPARWDLTGQVGWFGGHEPEAGPEWNEWYGTSALAGAAGFYATRHLKLDLELFTTGTGRLITNETLSVPGDPFPVFVNREHRFRTSGIAAGLHYQLFENTWFHPFAGGGVELARESHRVETRWVSRPFPPGSLPGAIPEQLDESTLHVRPYVTAGFKWYATERMFFRSELRGAFSSRRAESVTWRTGVGVDF